MSVTYANEGGGAVAACSICGWLRWDEARATSDKNGRDHKCRSGDPCWICRLPVRLGDDGCPHYVKKARA